MGLVRQNGQMFFYQGKKLGMPQEKEQRVGLVEHFILLDYWIIGINCTKDMCKPDM